MTRNAREKDSLESFFEAIGRIPRLSHQEEVLLGQKSFARTQLIELSTQPGARMALSESDREQIEREGLKARERLVKGNLRLVVYFAEKYSNRGVDLLDLIQEGSIGLQRAAEKFDPTLGYRFSTYASYWIRQGIVRALNEQSRAVRLPQNIIQQFSTIRRVRQQLTQEFRYDPTAAEVAGALGVSLRKYEMLRNLERGVISLDTTSTTEDRSDEIPLGDTIPSPSEPEEQIHALLRREELEFHASLLSDRELEVILYRYGLEGNSPLSLLEIADRLGMPPEKVRQISWRARKKLKRSITLLHEGEERALENLM